METTSGNLRHRSTGDHGAVRRRGTAGGAGVVDDYEDNKTHNNYNNNNNDDDNADESSHLLNQDEKADLDGNKYEHSHSHHYPSSSSSSSYQIVEWWKQIPWDAFFLRLSSKAGAILNDTWQLASKQWEAWGGASKFGFVLSSCGRGALPAAPPLSEMETQAVLHLLRQVVPFDDERHLKFLEQLWKVSKPGEELPARKGDHWKGLGFQGKDPATDFRGMGVFGLKCLLFFAEHFPKEYSRLLNAGREYPFACAGINIAHMLLQICSLHILAAAASNGERKELPMASRPPWPLANLAKMLTLSSTFSDVDADLGGFVHESFGVLFCLSFLVLDEEWERLNASYMQFPQVIADAKQRIETALGDPSVDSPAEFAERLGLGAVMQEFADKH